MIKNLPKYFDKDKVKAFHTFYKKNTISDILIKFLEDNFYINENEGYVELTTDYNYITVNNKDRSYKITSEMQARVKGSEMVLINVIVENILYDHEIKYLTVFKTDYLFDGSMSAMNKLTIESLQKKYGFDIVEVNKKGNVFSVNFVSNEITIFNSDIEDERLSTEEDLKKSLKYFFIDPDYIRHEALHTTYLSMENLSSNVADHHYYYQEINPEFNKYIDLALDNLMQAYNCVASPEEKEVKKMLKNTLLCR